MKRSGTERLLWIGAASLLGILSLILTFALPSRSREGAPLERIQRYNQGTALLAEQRFPDARDALTGLLGEAEEWELRRRAAFNLGNADLEPAFADSTLAGRGEALRRAIEAYRVALRTDPVDLDAKWNLELALSLLAPEDAPDAGGGGGQGGGGEDREPGAELPASPQGATSPTPGEEREGPTELLESAAAQELRIQRERLRKPQPPGPILP